MSGPFCLRVFPWPSTSLRLSGAWYLTPFSLSEVEGHATTSLKQKARPLSRPGLCRSDEPERAYMPPLLPGGVVVPPLVPVPT